MLTTTPSPALRLLERAEDALARHDPAGAAALFRRIVALEPAQAGTLYVFGQALRDLGRAEEGGAWRRRAFQTDPAALPTANHRMGVAWARAGRTGMGIAGQLQALDQDPGHRAAADALERLAAAALSQGGNTGGMDGGLWIRTGHAAFRLGFFVVAEGAFRQAAAAAPDDPAPHRYLGDTGAAMGDHRAAAAAFAHAVRLAPDHGEHRRRLADSLFRLDRMADAERHLTHALALDPGGAGLWADLGLVRFHRQNGEQALPAQARSIRLEPQTIDYRRCLADTLFLLDRTAEAERHVGSALALDPGAPILWTGLGHVRFRQRKHGGAAAAFVRALALTPGVPDLERFRRIAAYRHLNARVMAGEGTEDDSGTGRA
ncbi:tetratricopeptide (TPR) repeat protein [Azospirillum fermentarium]|uniref:tetratricopeptide repeat protein n=1 Tax=Azospirillum fermentarium TaxID=1233114 RepID=UPI002226589D|nr:tetratricopeptide repeat protein [Azospirillum fermentarium]MCW2249504.1 tetratricopeptide (TPR) repeat protein [Azospirillum fermentarium]